MGTSTTKFLADLAMGEKGERHVANVLKKHYGADQISWIGRGKGFDFRLIYEAAHNIELYEVKTDFRAKETGNLFFEYRCNNRLSGLTATQANKWAVLIPHMQVILVFCPKRMFNYLQKTPKARKIVGGDRMAVEGYVIPAKFLLGKSGVEMIPTKTRLTEKKKTL